MMQLPKKTNKTLRDYIDSKLLKNKLNYLERYGSLELIHNIFKDVDKKLKIEEILLEKETNQEFIYFNLVDEDDNEIFYIYDDFERLDDITYQILGYGISRDNKIVLDAFEVDNGIMNMSKNIIFEFDYKLESSNGEQNNNGWSLRDNKNFCEHFTEMQIKHTAKDIRALKVGGIVRLQFLADKVVRDVDNEIMPVTIIEISEEGYKGRLEINPHNPLLPKKGHIIVFSENEIFDIYKKG